jgi:uncharacterized protein (TIGR02058 family)
VTVKRMVLEIGMGTDIRGADSTKAASRALRDALWRNSLNIADICGKRREEMIIDVHLGVPRPETVDHQAVLSVLPYGSATLHVTDGGLEVPTDDGHDSTIIAHAAAVVSLDID